MGHFSASSVCSCRLYKILRTIALFVELFYHLSVTISRWKFCQPCQCINFETVSTLLNIQALLISSYWPAVELIQIVRLLLFIETCEHAHLVDVPLTCWQSALRAGLRST
ncbi:hypothetical protein Tsp_05277 [Trichinella spiralis]|uniref:hypothetical protein n=1 Tax=Trichinella spiralis TaxID=6334 RepID=UPI0001EFEC84|nr:hypothetical protein Tsp_05277 [Trichinella spiralis]